MFTSILATILNWFKLRPVPQPQPTPSPLPPPSPQFLVLADRLIILHNEERVRRGLPEFRHDERLSIAARLHSGFMARSGRFNHGGIGDGTPWSRILDAGYAYTSASENIAMGQVTVEEVMGCFMGDAYHKANILGDYQDIGVGVSVSIKGIYYWVVDFGCK